MNIPNYLKDFSTEFEKDPRAANLAWWRQAKFGLFIHYGLYSQHGRHEWVQLRERIPVSQYEKLADSFKPTNFDADFITDLALEAEMRYVNLVSCHHESFALWDSKHEPFNSWKYAQRDLVAELSEACDRKGLGFFTYYTYALNWRHPYYMSRELFSMARPDYDFDEPRYKFSKPEDMQIYMTYVHDMIKELLTRYKPLAGMWLDLIMAYYAQPDLIPVEETYKLVRETSDYALVSFKQGATGTEDFATPERTFRSLEETTRKRFGDRSGDLARNAWEANKNKHNEVSATMQEDGWGWKKDSRHFNADEILQLLGYTLSNNCNLLLNTGPLPDGSIHEEDVATLREVGRRIRSDGWPQTGEALENRGSAGAG